MVSTPSSTTAAGKHPGIPPPSQLSTALQSFCCQQGTLTSPHPKTSTSQASWLIPGSYWHANLSCVTVIILSLEAISSDECTGFHSLPSPAASHQDKACPQLWPHPTNPVGPHSSCPLLLQKLVAPFPCSVQALQHHKSKYSLCCSIPLHSLPH